jgi:predicted O-methyltransferase YrrM
MFHEISQSMKTVMDRLEERDARDRHDGTPHLQRLRQIPPETGRFLAIMASSAPAGAWIEVGTSAGYSAMWISLACRVARKQLTTFEILPAKAALARANLAEAQVNDVVTSVEGDFLVAAFELGPISFCFLDAEKDVYEACYEVVVPLLVPGGLLICDNAISHQSDLQPLIDEAMADVRIDAVLVPIGKGELVCRKL